MKRTFLAVVRYSREINEVRSDDVTVNTVVVTKLNLDASTKWRKHLSEDDLLVPDWLIAVLSHRSLALQTRTQSLIVTNIVHVELLEVCGAVLYACQSAWNSNHVTWSFRRR